MGIRDSISATQSRVEVLRRTLQLHKSKREEYAKIVSQQLQGIVSFSDLFHRCVFYIVIFMSQLHALGYYNGIIYDNYSTVIQF